jgi:quinol monooxygenase YgiN
VPFLLINKFKEIYDNMVLIEQWVSQSASNSHLSPKMSVDSESTHQNTSRMM